MRNLCCAFLALITWAVVSSNPCSAQITGVFTDQGIVNGAQVFGFEITSVEDITALDFSNATGGGFAGSFNNTGIDTDFDSIPDFALTFSAAAPQPGSVQETYFSFDPTNLLSIVVVDSVTGGNFLGAAFTISGGGTLVPAGVATNVAYFSTDGSQPVSGDVPITASVIPEPTTFALTGLGLCGLLGVRRRRS